MELIFLCLEYDHSKDYLPDNIIVCVGANKDPLIVWHRLEDQLSAITEALRSMDIYQQHKRNSILNPNESLLKIKLDSLASWFVNGAGKCNSH